MRNIVTVYSRHNCHLCEVALETLEHLQGDLDFDIEKIHIDGKQHDFFRVDPVRFKSSLEKHRQHQ